jgi:hypothetical protein
MNTPKQIGRRLTGLPGLSYSLNVTHSVLTRHLWVWPIVAAVLLGAVGWWVHRSVEDAMRLKLEGDLQTILNADIEALRVWTTDQESIVRLIASRRALRPAVGELLKIAAGPNASSAALLQSRALGEIRRLLNPTLNSFGYVDFFVLSPSMEVVAANHDSLIRLVVEGERKAFVQKVLSGSALISKPFRSTVSFADTKGELRAGMPTMFAAAPIPDDAGKPMAVLAFRLRPEAAFTEILQTARFGYSGETYAFDENGLLLSQSRFDSDLKRLGLLPDLPDAHSILTVETRDPQVNMMEGDRPSLSRSEQPLTKLVARAVAGKDGVEMTPYRDYRGVPSVGACRWLDRYGFGVATEVDVADAFGPLYVLRRAIWCLFGLLVLCAAGILISMVVISWQQRRMEKAATTIKQLGQYTLEEKIGQGGMGSVYRARHAFLRRPTAVKMLSGEKVDEGALARFEREVQLTSQLNHPNTIAVYDYGRTPEGVFYYAMEYLEGINLEELVKRYGPLPDGRVLGILGQMCGSLAEAHGIGLIHRDIKPANIILTSRAGMADFVKVLDFGLVKSVEGGEEAKLTQANVTVGTPFYLSPEAIERPDRVSALSDVYAIGAVGYFLVTGTTVFTGKTVMEVCMKHVRATVDEPSKRLGRPISPGLEALLLRCLAKDPTKRPAGTRAMTDELAQCEPLQRWTRADAESWWADFRKESGAGSAQTPTSPDQQPGETVLAERMP